ncbi:hypothetical protein VWN94_10350, partial [Campylobacter coli]|nr:hypothetical protein [Campylobacter coli]
MGLKLGLTFQINDDIIDETMSEEESGKPSKHDEHKNSFVKRSINKDKFDLFLKLFQIYSGISDDEIADIKKRIQKQKKRSYH